MPAHDDALPPGQRGSRLTPLHAGRSYSIELSRPPWCKMTKDKRKGLTGFLGFLVGLLTPGKRKRDVGTFTSLESFLAVYEPSDSDTSTENEKPRPPFLSRVLTYVNENVRVVCIPAGQPGWPHKSPVDGWNVFAFLDGDKDELLTAHQAVYRLTTRKRKEK